MKRARRNHSKSKWGTCRQGVCGRGVDQAENIVASLNEDELEEWKSAVRNGVEKGDWTDLTEHRMDFLDCRTVGSHLIVITARLEKPLLLNESLGVPIDQRMFYCFYLLFFWDTHTSSYAFLANG